MKAIDYIFNNLNRLNKPILTQLLAQENVELTDELWEYLQYTYWNTNKAFLKEWGIESESTIEEWPKLIHVIRDEQTNKLVMAADSDFSTFTQAYDFITNTWEERSEECTSEYIVLKFMDSEIQADDGHAIIVSPTVSWWKGDTVYSLSQDKFQIRDDS